MIIKILFLNLFIYFIICYSVNNLGFNIFSYENEFYKILIVFKFIIYLRFSRKNKEKTTVKIGLIPHKSFGKWQNILRGIKSVC